MFETWCYKRAGVGDQYRYASVAESLRVARQRGTHTGEFRPGFSACRINGGGWTGPGHTGIVEAVHGDGSVTTIEGNTSPGAAGSQRDGGGVWRRRRPKSYWNRQCIRINFGTQAPTSHAATIKESDDMFSEADRALLAALRTTQGEDRARLDRTLQLLELAERRALRMVADEKDGTVWLIVPGILRAPVEKGAVDAYRAELGFTGDVPKWGHETLMAIPTAGRPA